MASAAASYSGEEEEEIPWAGVPVAIQTTSTGNADGGTVKKIEKKTRGIKTVYEAEVHKPDETKAGIKAGEDGTLIKIEDDDD